MYYDGDSDDLHVSILLFYDKQEGNLLKLIDSSYDQFVRIWEFHSGNLLKKIKIYYNLTSLCFLNNNFLLVSGGNYQISLIDIQKGEYIKSFRGHSDYVCSIKKVELDQFGECIISQGSFTDHQILLWKINY